MISPAAPGPLEHIRAEMEKLLARRDALRKELDAIDEALALFSVRSTRRTEVRENHGDLTLKQAAILEFISAFVEQNDYPPTMREIAKAFGIGSTNGVNDHLNALVRKGRLHRSIKRARGLTVCFGAKCARCSELAMEKPDAGSS